MDLFSSCESEGLDILQMQVHDKTRGLARIAYDEGSVGEPGHNRQDSDLFIECRSNGEVVDDMGDSFPLGADPYLPRGLIESF